MACAVKDNTITRCAYDTIARNVLGVWYQDRGYQKKLVTLLVRKFELDVTAGSGHAPGHQSRLIAFNAIFGS